MDLFGALNNAFTGINRTQDALSVVAGNVAGANEPGYVRRVYNDQSGLSGQTGFVQRQLDTYVQKQLWGETSASGYTSTQSDYVKQLDAAFGDPSSNNTIASKYNDFTNAMTALQSNPGNSAAQATLISTAQTLAQKLNSTSNSVQSLRTSAEDALSQAASDANALLGNLAKINGQISNSGGNPDPSLLDARDAALQSLSSYMDITPNIASNGVVTVTTKTGLTLVDGSGQSTLSFASKSPLTATSVYNSNAALSGTGTLTLTTAGGSAVDLLASGAIHSGKIAGLVDLRDTLLPKAQSQLDDLAAGLSSALSDNTVNGTQVANGYQVDLSGLQSGNTVHLDFTDASGKAHHVSIVNVTDPSKLPLSASATADPNDEVIGVDFSKGVASALSAINGGLAALGAGVTAAQGSTANALQITAAAPASVKALSATVTVTALQGQGTALALFTDAPTGNSYTASLDGIGQHLGYASRIIVNPALISNPAAFSDYTGSTSADDPTRMNDLVQRLATNGVTVSAASGLGLASGSATVSALIKQIAQTQANDTNQLTSLNDSQSTILASVQSRFNQTSGVNMDQELTNLTQLQNVYAANAKVLAAVNSMFDVLMKI